MPDSDNTFTDSGRTAVIQAGIGNDRISVRGGHYNIFADGGNNILAADPSQANLYTDAGNDTITVSGTGSHQIYAGAGNNRLTSAAVSDQFWLSEGSALATIIGFGRNDRIRSNWAFEELSIRQVGSDTQIAIASTQDVLAVLAGVTATTVDSSLFSPA